MELVRISFLFNRAIDTKAPFFFLPGTSFSLLLLNFLRDEGYVSSYSSKEGEIMVFLTFLNGVPLLRRVNLVSRPSIAFYTTKKRLMKGLFLISNSQGLALSSSSFNLGGKILFHIV